jgi:hypothetical protein
MYWSMQGTTKKMPGPFGPPGLIRPSLKMTALSYSVTTYNNSNVCASTTSQGVNTDLQAHK